jgi:hypothetical protein
MSHKRPHFERKWNDGVVHDGSPVRSLRTGIDDGGARRRDRAEAAIESADDEYNDRRLPASGNDKGLFFSM